MFRAPISPFASTAVVLTALLALPGCSDSGDSTPGQDAGVTPDGGQDGGHDAGGDAGTDPTAHCDYVVTDPTAGAGGTVTAGTLEAAAVQEPLDLPVGSTLGAYGDRAVALNADEPVDGRTAEIAGPLNTNTLKNSFAPSVGIETFPMAKVVALSAGGEKILLIKVDLGVGFESLTWDVAEELGPEFHGKVLIANSHTHHAYGHYTADFEMQVAFGPYRSFTYDRLRDQLVALSQQALANLQPARIGFAHDGNFDPMDLVNRDRRPDNDDLFGGMKRDDHDLFVIRIDADLSGDPIAMIPVIGLHGTIMGGDNLIVTTDAPGQIARGLEEEFDQSVVVMHLQGLTGDVSPAGTGGIDCSDLDRCYNFARSETVGRYARDMIMPVYEEAGMNMQTSVPIEMLTRSIPLGPDKENFVVRGGALQYGPWDGTTLPDGEIFDTDMNVISPIDEFNAPNGAALCGDDSIPLGQLNGLPGSANLPVYEFCLSVNQMAANILANIFSFSPVETPLCYSTRTTIAALRIGDYLVAGVPGEPVSTFVDALRGLSPAAPDKTIVVGYANDNIGYLLTPEDWLRGGYEPSINMWGPLEGQYIAERTADLLALAETDQREDATQVGDSRMAVPPMGDGEPLPAPDPSPMAGTVPASVPADLFVRPAQEGVVPATAQPPAQVARLDSAFFTWIGEDPMRATPEVHLERESACGSGSWSTVTRRSGRAVRDQDIVLTWTPDPLAREDTTPRTHYWTAEWQAVTPYGTPGLDRVQDRPGVPLGCYRFHVTGQGDSAPYDLTSQSFEVVPTALQVTAAVDTTTNEIVVTAHYDAPHGWRLLEMNGASNRPVPVAQGETLTIDVDTSTGMDPAPADFMVVGAGGEAEPIPVIGTPTTVTVTDAFGNTGSATIM